MGADNNGGNPAMTLLFKRNQKMVLMGRIKFQLWAKFDLTPEEKSLIDKYQADNAVVSFGDPKTALRNWRIALIAGAILGILIGFIYIAVIGMWGSLPFTLIAMGACIYLIHHQIREVIFVSDIISGRHFTCDSVITLIEKENLLFDTAGKFVRFLEEMKNWGGAAIITVEPDKAPKVDVVE
jgi:hypothetical protein